MSKNKWLMLVVVITMVTALLEACGAQPEPTQAPVAQEPTQAPEQEPTQAPEPEPTEAAEPVTIEWWTVSSEEYTEEVQRAMAKEFEASHPNIKVNVTVLPSSGFGEKMTTALGAGEGAPTSPFSGTTTGSPRRWS